jgi:hypothetical protein
MRFSASTGLRFAHVDADAIVFWRETPDERLLVLARRAPGTPVPLPGVTEAANPYTTMRSAAGTACRRAMSWPGGRPNRRRYSWLNCDALS